MEPFKIATYEILTHDGRHLDQSPAQLYKSEDQITKAIASLPENDYDIYQVEESEQSGSPDSKLWRKATRHANGQVAYQAV